MSGLVRGLIESAFKKWWPDFRREVQEAVGSSGDKKEQPKIRTDRDLLEELLETTRSIAQHASQSKEENTARVIGAGVTKSEESDLERIKAGLEKRRRRLLIAALAGAKTVRLDGDTLSVEFSPEQRHSRDTLAKADNLNVL